MIGAFRKTTQRIICALLCGLMVIPAGCGSNTAQSVSEETIELLDPVGVALNYEVAERRTLYDAKVYSALVTPYVEEYELEKGMNFKAYDAFPGEKVSKDATLLHSDTENVDKQIEDMVKSIEKMDEDYNENVTDGKEAMAKALENQKYYTEIIERLDSREPEEKIAYTDPATGVTTMIDNPDYAAWEQQYRQYDGPYRKANLAVDRLKEAQSQRDELYELDRAYNEILLRRKKALKNNSTLQSGMDGTVAGMVLLNEGSWMNSESPLMAVADTDRIQLLCDYITKGTVNKAEDIYAIVDGKRVEVDYQPIDTDEYKRLEEKNGKVYSVFTLQDSRSDVKLGDYAVIVVRNKTAKDVVTVPKAAIRKDETTSYVYVVNGNDSVYTPIKTGMTDGVYTEVLSGVNEGDNILVDQTVKIGSNIVKTEIGEMHYSFSDSGFAYYPSTTWVKNPVEYGTVYFVEQYVKEYQQVQKGDVLAKVRVVPDQIELNRRERQLQRERERLNDLKKLGEEDNKKAIASKEKYIAELEDKIAEMKENFAITEIKATVSGVISSFREYEPEDLVQRNQEMFLISEETRSYVYVQDENGVLTYGNEVTIHYEDENGKDGTIQGEIVTLNSVSLSKTLTSENRIYLGWGMYTTGALAMVSPEDVGKLAAGMSNGRGGWNRGYYKVEATLRSMDGVVLVPRKAVKDHSGVPYVMVKQPDGTVKYQSFLAGGSDNSNYWVVDGLTEGMELCIE